MATTSYYCNYVGYYKSLLVLFTRYSDVVVIAVAVVMILPCTHNNKLSDIRHTLEHPSLTSVLRETHSLGATRIFNWLWKSLASASEDFLGTTYVNLSHL